jgi:hypothetical protein
MVMSRKRWGWESGRNFMFRASGRSEKQTQGLLRSRLSGVVISKERAAAVLVDVLRSLPPHDPTVGKDCLVTTIQRSSPHVHIKYEPHDIRHVSVVFTGRTVTLPASYTPWIITPGLLAAPRVISGQSITHHSGGFNFVVEAPELGGDLTIMSSQQRRLWSP